MGESDAAVGWEVVPLRSSWLWRMIAVRSPEDEDFDVVYNGWGLGSERVIVNGSCAKRVYHSSLTAFPRITFQLGRHSAAVNVRASLWWAIIQQFELEVDGVVVYRERPTAAPCMVPQGMTRS